MKAAIIGLGAIGAGIAVNLHRSNRLHRAWNRTPQRAAALAADHPDLPITDQLADAVAGAELVITCVSTDADLRQVIDGLAPHLQAGALVVDTSTVSAATARELATTLAQGDVGFLDAPVSGGKEGADNGELVMMVGGERAQLDRARPVLAAFTRRIEHMGPVGAGQATKAVNQVMAAGINQAVTEALAFAEQLGLDLHRTIDLLAGGAAGSWFLSARGHSLVDRRFTPGFRVALHHKDLKICQAMAGDLGAHLPLVEMTLIHYQRLMQAGHGDEDISALFRQKQNLFDDDHH